MQKEEQVRGGTKKGGMNGRGTGLGMGADPRCSGAMNPDIVISFNLRPEVYISLCSSIGLGILDLGHQHGLRLLV